ncbi:DUF3887 domain-containing protein [Thermococcus sp. 21S9]|uniref:DUF3887 domain-containing protein n=1 Tax=Thermococcus sp. 21S9 TaxID=1638223 RepID=UPI00143B052B|nr:DUF3887 domain-containing protein [Thermococcus sp. 21S9]NJE54690.1 DUF3887 domain-containing protein [Thermococcus sp. 21S9]
MSMKRLLAVLVFLLFIGYASALTPQKAMMEAWKTGNYSIVEPYLSPEMKRVFTEKTFTTVRDELVKLYGPIKGYTLEKTEEKNGYQIYFYRVTAEKGGYTVSVTVKDGKVEGFHLVPGFSPEKAVYPLLGGLLGLLLLWAYLRKFHAGELILGALLVIPVLIFQPLVQELPGFLGVTNTAFLVVWTGLIAGLFQEPLKYYFSRDKTLGRAVYIGAGFGLGEAVYVAFIASIGGGSWIGLIERTLALLFHASTTALFAYSHRNSWGRKALLAMVLVHWLTDSIATYWHTNPSTTVLVAGYVVMLLTVLAILSKLLPLAKTENEEPEVRW